jgi:CBS domain-containing protein
MQSTVRDILETKGTHVWTVSPSTTAYDALQLMADHEIGSVLVVDAGRLLGIFSERDYARKVILKGRSSRETTVSDLMTRDVYCVELGQSVQECMAIMTDRRVRHLPVVEGDRLMGVVSIGDVVSKVIENHEFVIQELVHYIAGRA